MGLVAAASAQTCAPTPDSGPRILISTDIGGDDKDDAQSMIHALLYADEVDYRGFVATTTDDGPRPSMEILETILDAYDRDLPRLRQANPNYPRSAALEARLVQGAVDPAWPGPVSAGARYIVAEARKAAPRDPLYVLTWGPIHDLARALKAAPDIVPNLRVFSIAGYGQHESDPRAFRWLQEAVASDPRYADLWWINAESTSRGMYIGPEGQNDPELNTGWVDTHIDGHGALGDLYHDVFAVDLYGPGTPDGLKMGDTASLLYLLDDFDNDTPTGPSWGGRYAPSPLGTATWTDSTDPALAMGRYDGARSVWRHREAIWADFARHLDRAQGSAPAATSTSC